MVCAIKDNDHYLTWSQLGLTQQDDGLVSNLGLGQRWARGNWLVGYNTFYDNLLDQNLQRAGFGAEAWGNICDCQQTITSRLPPGMNKAPRWSNEWHAVTT